MKELFERNKVVKSITNKKYYFYMRTYEQSDMDFKKKSFTEERFKYAFLLDDMAGLISCQQIAHFLSYHASLFRENKHDSIRNEDLALIKRFIADAWDAYRKIDYIDLPSIENDV